VDEPRDPAAQFEGLARRLLSHHYAVQLARGSLPAWRMSSISSPPTDTSSAIRKYFAPVRGVGLPSAKFSIIAEHVWLLERASPTAFLVSGNDREVPLRWLARCAQLAVSVAFLFLSDDAKLERLGGP
jgi:hypothetical protein